MSLNRCSRLLLAALVVLSVVAVPAAAVSVTSADTPKEAQVGTQVSGTVTLNNLYQDPQYESWQLAGSTELTNVTWTVTWYDQTGAKVSQKSYDGQNFSGAQVSANQNHAKVTVKVSGTVPAVENFTYEPAQQFLFTELRQERKGGTSNVIVTKEAHHFTEQSKAARQELDAAKQAIAAAGSPEKAQKTFDNAVSAYNNQNFELAIELANEAEAQAEQSQQSQQTTQLLIYAGAGIVVLLLLVGGFLYWRSQQESYDKLG